MNVKLKKTFDFATGMVYQKKFLINLYSIELKMVTATNNPTDQNIAYERIHYWIDSVLNDGVLIADDSELISAYRETGQRLITLPTDPVDQVIGFILFSKFNAITESRLIITDIEISSIHGDSMIYVHNENESINGFDYTGWWDDPKPCWANNSKKKRGNGKVITLDRMPEWKELDLDWENTELTNDKDHSTVLFADFLKDEKK
jgi:hypothetical protein